MAKKAKAPKTYKGICHTTCYWKNTLWNVGEIYEGDEPFNKHFSVSGVREEPIIAPTPGDDPRSNVELRAVLQNDFNFRAPKNWTRKQIWNRLYELGNAQSKDALLQAESDIAAGRAFKAPCGFLAKSGSGLGAHTRKCPRCAEIAAEKEAKDEEKVDGDSG